MVRFYGDYIKKGVIQSTLSGFIGYQFKEKFLGGVEYNYQFNYKFNDGENKDGYSLYGLYNFTEHWQIFARYDQVFSNTLPGDDQPWALAFDGSAIIGGIQYSPIKQIKIALDYQDWVPYARNMKNLAFIFLNFEFEL
jgi:hypothetical protein